jgi:hypothetical protein
MRFDIDYIGPSGHPGTLYSLEASSLKNAIIKAPVALALGSQWLPTNFKVVDARPSLQ